MIIDIGETSSHATTHNDINFDTKAIVLGWNWTNGIELSGGSLFDAPYRSVTLTILSYVLTDPHLFAGIGIAADNHVTSTLTSRPLFQTQAGFHYHHWRVLVRHLSNAGFKGENIGERMIRWLGILTLRESKSAINKRYNAAISRSVWRENGGRYWDRTSDPCRVKAVLYR